MATDARTKGVADWITEHADLRRNYKTPREAKKPRKELRHKRRTFAGRCYKLPSGRAAIGSYLFGRIGKLLLNKCGRCGKDERQSRYHLFAECEAWQLQIQAMWEDIGKLCGRKHPSVALIKDESAVLSFLRDAKVG